MCVDFLYGNYGSLKCKTNVYRIETDPVSASILSRMLVVSEDDYDSIKEIIGADDKRIHRAYERVSVDISKDETCVSDVNETSDRSVGMKPGLTVSVSVYGKDETECDRIIQVIERAFSRVIGSLDIDITTGLELVGSVISLGDSYSMNGGIDKNVGDLVNIGSALSGISTAASSFSDDQKVYYNALKNYGKGKLNAQTSASSGSSLKYPVLGAAFGLILSVGTILLIYLCNGKIKSNDELSARYGTEASSPISFAGKRRFLKRCADVIRGNDPDSAEIDKLTALDGILISLKETGAEKVILFRQDDSPSSIAFSETLKNYDDLSGIEFIGEGDPCVSSDVLKLANDTDSVIAVAELDHTKQETVDRWVSLCRRHKKNIAGIVTVSGR